MNIRVDCVERQCLIDIEGHMTEDCAEQLRRTLFSPLAADHEFVIDLSKVNDIDVSGIRLLVMLKLEAYVRGSKLHLIGHDSHLAEIMELCELQKFLDKPA
jgi:anti-anti-sigma factor